MMKSLPHPLTIALTLILTLFPAQKGLGQSGNDLRRENERLKTELADLRLEHEAALRRIASLEAEVQRLLEQFALRDLTAEEAATQTTPDDSKRITIDESKPDASPRALYRALVKNYAEKLGNHEKGEPNSIARTLYQKEVERWLNNANRQFRGRILWQVRIQDSQATSSGSQIKVSAVDPVTDTALGEPFWVRLKKSDVHRLRQLEVHKELDVLTLKGVLTPRIRLTPEQEMSETDAFGRERLVGPFAAFAFNVEVISLIPREDTPSIVKEPGSRPD